MAVADRTTIVGLGASTAVGRDAWACAAAVRAGLSGFSQHPFMVDTAGEPMHAAMAPWLDIALQGVGRFEALLFPAIDEALAEFAPARPDSARCALALALPSARPGLPGDLASALVRSARRRYASHFTSAAVFESGHAAGQLALSAARAALRSGRLDAVLVAGVDSWIEPRTLEWLEDSDQLHGAGALHNAWGFIPGEAGAAALLVREPTALAAQLAPMATLLSVGSAQESNRIKADTVCTGEGLTAAFRETLDALPAGCVVSDVYCDMNGEPYRADEFGFTALRTKEHFSGFSDFHAPADCWGDVCAAGAVLHVMLACVAARKRYANGPYALVWASAERGERAAALLAFEDARAGGR